MPPSRGDGKKMYLPSKVECKKMYLPSRGDGKKMYLPSKVECKKMYLPSRENGKMKCLPSKGGGKKKTHPPLRGVRGVLMWQRCVYIRALWLKQPVYSKEAA